MHTITIHNTQTNTIDTKEGNINYCIQALHNLGYKVVRFRSRCWVYQGIKIIYRITYK